MRVPLLLLALSVIAALASAVLGGGSLTVALLTSVLSGIAALLILLKQILLQLSGKRQRPPPQAGAGRSRAGRDRAVAKAAVAKDVPADPAGPQIVIDGSNVMHWNGGTPRLASLRMTIAELRAKGWQPGIIFDANAGYAFAGRYLDDSHFAKLLDLPHDRVLVVAKGQPADPTILEAARSLQAKVLSNDRYRDWVGDYPEVANQGLLVRGGFRDGALWLDEGALAA